MRPDSYREQDGCWNCKYVLFLMNYEYWDGMCGLSISPEMRELYRRHEHLYSRTVSLTKKEAHLFYAYNAAHNVLSHGICAHHEPAASE